MGFFSLSNCYLDQGTLSSAISEADFVARGASYRYAVVGMYV